MITRALLSALPTQLMMIQLFIGLCYLLASSAYAMETRPLIQQPLQHSQTDSTFKSFQRKQWDLSEQEWSRYQELMQGIRGSISPKTISPIEVLGTHARSEQERMRYAKRWASMMHEDITRILAFQQAYDTAWKTLYPDEKIIDMSQLNLQPSQFNPIQAGDRLLAFIRIKGCDPCKSFIQRLQQRTHSKRVQLDIYFLDTVKKKDDRLIQQWAVEQAIDQQRIKQGRITLNHDQGALFSVAKKIAAPNKPLLYRIRNQSIVALELQ